MRGSSSPACALLLAACSSLPGLDTPQIILSPQAALLRVGGRTSMESPAPGGGVQPNPSVAPRELGFGQRDEEFGGTAHIGDGFSGAEVSYLKVDQSSTRAGTLSAGWGALLAGDLVQTRLVVDDLRLRYLAALVSGETEAGLSYAVGLGPALFYRLQQTRSHEVSGARRQSVDVDGLLPCAAGRARLGYRGFGVQADYAINPDLDFGGELDGVQHDIEVVGTYTFQPYDVTVFAGYRRADLKARGTEGGLAFDSDLHLDGYVMGVQLVF